IIGMHHDQDIRNMGGLRKYMPITWITFLIGTLSLVATPWFSGFYSKDTIIEAVALSHIAGSGYAYFAVVASVFVTALYSFRVYFLVFHGKENFHHKPYPAADDHDHGHGHAPHESPWVVTLPLVLLAIPSVAVGYFTIGPMLYGDFFSGAIFVDAARHGAMHELGAEFHGPMAMALHSVTTLPFWLMVAGFATAWLCYIARPELSTAIKSRFAFINRVLDNKYYADWFNENVIAGGSRLLGRVLWRGGDAALIDGLIVNGSARTVGAVAGVVRRVQSGYLYWYALVMILGVVGLMTWQLWPYLGVLLAR
ncbi:MAG: NADH-quinone oxidoreductase subunit L, partial [Burkholderiaceae bacterium]|nr:NADH-quinone oxidoreductase subunit L [Burkholderiaceae bacterium]